MLMNRSESVYNLDQEAILMHYKNANNVVLVGGGC